MNHKDIISEKQVTSSEILLYQTEDGKSRIEVRLENETIWLSQKMLSELFQVTVPTISVETIGIKRERLYVSDVTLDCFTRYLFRKSCLR